MNPELRKSNTELFLTSHNLPTNGNLPVTEAEDTVKLKNNREVGERIFCLLCLCGTADQKGAMVFTDYLKNNNLWGSLSPMEQSYLSKPSYGDKVHNDASWRLEALYLLVWAVGLVRELPFPPTETDINDFVDVLPKLKSEPIVFINSLTLRPIAEIMDTADLIYRTHWASKRSDKLDQGVLREWHHAINWLTNCDRENWDSVSTDT